MSVILKSKNRVFPTAMVIDTFVINYFTTLCQQETIMKVFVYLKLYIKRFYKEINISKCIVILLFLLKNFQYVPLCLNVSCIIYVMYLYDCQNLCITICCMFFLHLSLFFCYNMNLYFGPAAWHYIINNILSYLTLFLIYVPLK